MPFQPITADIEPTTVCNFRCSFCQSASMRDRKPYLDYEDFVRFLDELPLLLRVKIQGMGEPLLNKAFFEMVRYARRKGIYTVSVTNGSLLDEANCRKMIDSGLDSVLISVDGAAKETYEHLRPGGNFDLLCRNVQRLTRLRTHRNPRVGLWTVCMKENQQELPDIVRLGNELGVDGVGFQYNLSFWGKNEFQERLSNQPLPQGRIAEQVSHAIQTARALQMPLDVFKGDRFTPRDPCTRPWTGVYLTTEGYVIPCCTRADPDMLNAGRLCEQGDFARIWNNRTYRALRASLKKHDLWDYCAECYGGSSGGSQQ